MKNLICGVSLLMLPLIMLSAQEPILTAAYTPGNYSFSEEGLASWYGQEFAGRKTANGEVYDPKLLTAAHPSLPFGTMVQVTNLTNGKQVQVRINDRGPFKGNRSIDLSMAAATEIDLLSTGVGKVRLEAQKVATPTEPSAVSQSRTVQIISFSTAKSADTFNANLLQQGFNSRIETSPTGFFRVIIPAVSTTDLPSVLDRLKTAGYSDVMVRKD